MTAASALAAHRPALAGRSVTLPGAGMMYAEEGSLMKRARALGLLLAVAGVFALSACDDSALPPGGTYQSVSGVVVDAATQQPLSGATVTIDTVLTATTDASGKFSFPKVPVGDIDYQVTGPDASYKPYASPAHLAPDKPLVLTISLSH